MKLHNFIAASFAAWAVFAAESSLAKQQTPRSLAGLDVAVAEMLASARIPGAALIVIENERVVFSRT